MLASAETARSNSLVWHTHAAENPHETARVKEITGYDNVAYFEHLGILNNHSSLAHCIWLTDNEIRLLGKHQASLLHCPSTNLKLGSGVADTNAVSRAGGNIALGSDGAPANNRLDIFNEMRLAGLLAQWKATPGQVPAQQVFGWATTGGAKALGLQGEIGVLRQGTCADMVALDSSQFSGDATNPDEVYTHLVYSTSSADVSDVWVNSRQVVAERKLLTGDLSEIRREFAMRRSEVIRRAKKNW
jgi:cytosine/adenosine deaminase-related metal-dependent hydrolase